MAAMAVGVAAVGYYLLRRTDSTPALQDHCDDEHTALHPLPRRNRVLPPPPSCEDHAACSMLAPEDAWPPIATRPPPQDFGVYANDARVRESWRVDASLRGVDRESAIVNTQPADPSWRSRDNLFELDDAAGSGMRAARRGLYTFRLADRDAVLREDLAQNPHAQFGTMDDSWRTEGDRHARHQERLDDPRLWSREGASLAPLAPEYRPDQNEWAASQTMADAVARRRLAYSDEIDMAIVARAPLLPGAVARPHTEGVSTTLAPEAAFVGVRMRDAERALPPRADEGALRA